MQFSKEQLVDVFRLARAVVELYRTLPIVVIQAGTVPIELTLAQNISCTSDPFVYAGAQNQVIPDTEVLRYFQKPLLDFVMNETPSMSSMQFSEREMTDEAFHESQTERRFDFFWNTLVHVYVLDEQNVFPEKSPDEVHNLIVDFRLQAEQHTFDRISEPLGQLVHMALVASINYGEGRICAKYAYEFLQNFTRNVNAFQEDLPRLYA